MTFEELYNKFLQYKKNRVKRSTYNQYNIYTKEFLEKFKNKDVKKISFVHIQSFFDEFAKTRTYKTVTIIKNVIRSVFKYGFKYDLNSEEKMLLFDKLDIVKKNNKNPLELIEKKEEKNKIYTLEDLNKLFSQIKISEEEKFVYIFGLMTGMRVGEILALCWQDINFNEGFISVNKTLANDKKNNSFYLDTPKTENSIRKIYINNELKELLLKYKSLQDFNKSYFEGLYEKSKLDFVFRMRIGRHINQNILSLTIRKIKNIDKNFHFHLLRHSFISQMVNSEVNILYVSRIVGHSNSTITEKIYSHIQESKIKEVMLNAKIS